LEVKTDLSKVINGQFGEQKEGKYSSSRWKVEARKMMTNSLLTCKTITREKWSPINNLAKFEQSRDDMLTSNGMIAVLRK